jgi:hypothetical protein
MAAGGKVIARGSKRLKRAGVATVRLRGRVPARAKSVTIRITRGGLAASRVVRVSG